VTTESVLRTAILAGGVLLGLYLLDRVLLWAEARGWIYYRRHSGSRRSVGSGMLEVHALMEPEKRHVLELHEDERRPQDEEKDGGRPDLRR